MKQDTSLPGIKLVAIINGLAAVLHGVFWSLVFIRLPSPWSSLESIERNDLIDTYGLGIADLLWSIPLLTAGSILLHKRVLAGWLAAQMANALWWYSFTFILFRELSVMQLRPGTLLFLPFALFSVWSAGYLWKVRAAFLNNDAKIS